MAWTGSRLSFLTIVMIFVGLIKYGERTWVLRSASYDQLKGSLSIARIDPSPGNSHLIEEYNLRYGEGYNVIPNRVIEVQLPVDSAIFEDDSISKDDELLTAYGLFQIFKGLFVDVMLGFRDRDTSQIIFQSISYEKAFRLIEMELGFIYDMLFTKAMLVHNPWGFFLRIVSFTLTCIVLVLFSLATEMKNYSKLDLSITFLLLVVAISLEMYATLLLLSSNWTNVLLSMHKKTTTLQAINSLPLLRSPQWSNSIAQYSLLSFILKDQPMVCRGILKHFNFIEQLEQHRHVNYMEVPLILKEWIFNHLRKKLREMQKEKEPGTYNLEALRIARGNLVVQNYNHNELDWSTKVEFDQSILIWHIATDICCNMETETGSIQSKIEMSKVMSQYMIYLLVMKPSILPTGMGELIYEHTCTEAVKFFSTAGKTDPHTKLLQQYTTRPQLVGDKYRSRKSVLSDACRLSEGLISISNKEEKWSMIVDVWVEIIAYVANQSNGKQHSVQLTSGGEFLTHVWLLMAHFGLTQHFQTPQPRAVAGLIVR
ncbi:uncharacterized protein LOC127805004 isoform X2 [Diospyros lotus]|nr:uncharacterized protein LOC127805004 isoform X2 [Diospyros lotus]